jgi:hypothetical protein
VYVAECHIFNSCQGTALTPSDYSENIYLLWFAECPPRVSLSGGKSSNVDMFVVASPEGPPLSSSGLWLQIRRSRVRFVALHDFLRSKGSGTRSTQSHEDN